MNTNQPSAWIALNNNRIKAYADVIYLKDGDEFQIELFNPYQNSVLAKIYINDNLISTSGLVIRPGQRYFLDRYIDDNKKFKFNTYTVDSGTTPEVLESIKNNGSVRVDFYPEKMKYDWNITTTGTSKTNIIYNNPSIGIGDYFPSYNTAFNSNSTYNTVKTSSVVGNGFHVENVAKTENQIETGRIEGGSKSSQQFKTSTQEFDSYSCASSEWKILPDSHRPIEVKEIRNYCSSCGTRMKKQSWKFCPNCGEKL